MSSGNTPAELEPGEPGNKKGESEQRGKEGWRKQSRKVREKSRKKQEHRGDKVGQEKEEEKNNEKKEKLWFRRCCSQVSFIYIANNNISQCLRGFLLQGNKIH